MGIEQDVFRNICANTNAYIPTATINENKGHDVEEWGVVCGGVSRKERKGRNVIKLEPENKKLKHDTELDWIIHSSSY